MYREGTDAVIAVARHAGLFPVVGGVSCVPSRTSENAASRDSAAVPLGLWRARTPTTTRVIVKKVARRQSRIRP
jgi:hypothetical protein